jgi:ABC-type Zn uptake system ZnuABC Zn-binding protein ZnuA
MMIGILSRAQEDVLQVTASTSLIADVAQIIGGDRVEVSTLIPPSTDVHSFNLSPRDVVKIVEADVILMNGMRLEGALLDVIVANASVEPTVVSIGVPVLLAGLHDEDEGAEEPEILGILGDDLDCDDPLIAVDAEPEEAHTEEAHTDEDDDVHDHGPCDPHVWQDVANVMIWAENIASAFAATDPQNADFYAENAADYIAELETLDADLREQISKLPVEDRLLVTNHDFLGYFAAAYDFTMIGTVSLGTGAASEVSPQALARLVSTIESADVPAIFAEFSDDTRLADTVAAEVDGVQVIAIYSDSLSDAEGPAATYIDFMNYNTNTILNALSP